MSENKISESFKHFLPLNRKERFYTGTVLPQIICCNNFQNFNRFTKLINGFPKDLKINPDANSNNIIFMTEYSLKESFRELNDRFKYENVPTTKETPDLVVLITEPERILIVVEAKMYSSGNLADFKSQFTDQKKIINCIKDNLNIDDKNIFHLALVPEKYFNNSKTNDFQILFWENILESYTNILSDNYFYNVLKTALDDFENLRSAINAFSTSGKNMDEKLKGQEILDLHNSGKRFWIGRNYGLNGKNFVADIDTGGWKFFPYEVNYEFKPSNNNWFSSTQFVNAINRDHNQNIVEDKSEEEIDVWHFSYLGEEYFKRIGLNALEKYSLDVEIETVFIGKTGEPYYLKTQNREVNPNWAVILKDGRELKYIRKGKGMLTEGLWELNKCNIYQWEVIKNFYNSNK